jgi:hypothetical protein
MKTYLMEVVTQTLTIQANSEGEAELKYDAYFNGWGDADCPCGKGTECDCVDESEECYHNTTEQEEE